MDKSQVRSCISGSGSITYDPTTGVIGGGGGGTGTVTTVSVVTNDGVSGTVANATTTPAITLDLGTITPDAVSILGTGGNGYLKLPLQSSTVPTPITGVTVWADNLNRFGWVNPSAYAVSLDDTGLTASRNYTLPNASGTLALISDITSGYVPYTGATGNVNLGANTLIAALLKANASAGLGIQGSGGANSILVGAGGGQNSTFYGGVKLDYATASTLPVLDSSKNFISSAGTGFVKVTAGVVSYDTSTYLTGLTVGTTPITSGTVGRILFEGTGNVVQENAILNLDTTNGLIVGGTTARATRLTLINAANTAASKTLVVRNAADSADIFTLTGDGKTKFVSEASSRAEIYSSSGGVLDLYDAFGRNIQITATNGAHGVFVAAFGGMCAVGTSTAGLRLKSSSGTAFQLECTNSFSQKPLDCQMDTSGVTGTFKFQTFTASSTNYVQFNGGNGSSSGFSATPALAISSNRNVGINNGSYGTSAVGVLAIGTGTAPSGGRPADAFQLYSADIVANNAAPHFQTEAGDIVKLYKTGTYTQTYNTASRTVNAYTPDTESSAYTGIDNLQVGTVYAQVSDLNNLRVAYENLRTSYDNLIQVVTALIDDGQLTGLIA